MGATSAGPDGKDAGLEDAVRLSLGYTFLSKEVVVQLSSRVSCGRSILDNSKTGQERFRAPTLIWMYPSLSRKWKCLLSSAILLIE